MERAGAKSDFRTEDPPANIPRIPDSLSCYCFIKTVSANAFGRTPPRSEIDRVLSVNTYIRIRRTAARAEKSCFLIFCPLVTRVSRE